MNESPTTVISDGQQKAAEVRSGSLLFSPHFYPEIYMESSWGSFE